MENSLPRATSTSTWRLKLTLYLNYFIHGMGLIILAQNMPALAASWQVPLATVSFVISGVGIGRLIGYPLTGRFADRFSRRTFVALGMACYLLFALGMLAHPAVWLAYGLAILAGVANAALDAGTYPLLVELSAGKGSGTVLLKGAMSAGEFVLPLLVASLTTHHWWFGWSFLFFAALLLANFANLATVSLPPAPPARTTAAAPGQVGRARLATGLLLAYGYLSMALMIWFTQWVTLFAQHQLKLTTTSAHFLLSLYSLGSLLGVGLLFILLNRPGHERGILVTFNLIATLALFGLVTRGSQPLVAAACALVFGLTAAGGIMQTGLTLFMRLFPGRHGLVTGCFYFFGSLASFTVPLITGKLATGSIAAAFAGDLVIGALASLVSLALLLAWPKGGTPRD